MKPVSAWWSVLGPIVHDGHSARVGRSCGLGVGCGQEDGSVVEQVAGLYGFWANLFGSVLNASRELLRAAVLRMRLPGRGPWRLGAERVLAV